MAVNDNSLLGWPFVNHAMEIRGTQTERGSGRQTIVYPRTKFTFVVELVINPRALDPNKMETNLLEFIHNGRLYATLRSVDHPNPTMAFERLRSYNKDVLVPTKMEYPPATMTFHDDNSSVAAALWKEYRAFYQHEGRIGANAVSSNALDTDLIREFRQGNDLVGNTVRTDTSNKPSLGMRLKESDSRHFFDSIIIYDLGADPDSVNVYAYMYPMVTALAHDGLDYEDRTGQVGMSMTFDYEGYYQMVGMNNAQFHSKLEQFLGFAPVATSPPVQGHARMTPSTVGNTTTPSVITETVLPPIDESLLFSLVPSDGNAPIVASSIGPDGIPRNENLTPEELNALLQPSYDRSVEIAAEYEDYWATLLPDNPVTPTPPADPITPWLPAVVGTGSATPSEVSDITNRTLILGTRPPAPDDGSVRYWDEGSNSWELL